MSRSTESVSTQHSPPMRGVVHGQRGPWSISVQSNRPSYEDRRKQTEWAPLERLVPWKESTLAWALGDVGLSPSSGINQLDDWKVSVPLWTSGFPLFSECTGLSQGLSILAAVT